MCNGVQNEEEEKKNTAFINLLEHMRIITIIIMIMLILMMTMRENGFVANAKGKEEERTKQNQTNSDK